MSRQVNGPNDPCSATFVCKYTRPVYSIFKLGIVRFWMLIYQKYQSTILNLSSNNSTEQTVDKLKSLKNKLEIYKLR